MTLDDLIGTLIQSAREADIPNDKVALIVADLRKAAKEEKDDRPPAKRAKARFTILIRGDAHLRDLVAGGAWLVSQPDPKEPTAPKTPLLERLRRAVTVANESRRKTPAIKTWAEAMRWLKPKALKASESQVTIKAREPVEVVVLTEETISP